MALPDKDERNNDLYVAYNRALKSLGKKAVQTSREELIHRAVFSIAPRFYISYEEARRNVRLIMSGQSPRCSSDVRIAMYNDLSNLVAGYLRRHPRLNFNEALGAVLAEKRAPRFYVSERSALLIIYEKQRKKGGES